MKYTLDDTVRMYEYTDTITITGKELYSTLTVQYELSKYITVANVRMSTSTLFQFSHSFFLNTYST